MRSSGHGVLTHVMAGKMDAGNFFSSSPLIITPQEALTAWNTLFNGHDSDGVVSVTSQLAVTSLQPPVQVPAGADITPTVFHSGALLGSAGLPSIHLFSLPTMKFVGTQGKPECSTQGTMVPSIIDLLQRPKANDPGRFVELKPPIQ
jgi:hypothetical protein